MIEKKEGASTMANMPGAYVKLLECEVSRVPSASGITVVTSVAEAEELYGKDSQVAATMRRYSDHVTIGARDTRTAPIVCALQAGDVAAHSIGTGGADESHVSRVLRLATGAGFAPTNAWDDPTGADAVFVGFENGTVVHLLAGMNVEAELRQYAGPDNQPDAVLARKAAKAPVPFADAVEIARGACMAVGVDLTHVESRNGMLYVLIRGNYEQTLHVEQLVSAAMPAVVVQVLFARPRDSAVPNGYGPVEVRRSSPRETMVAAIIARQVEQGGVDTEGTRHEAERWCAMLAECVCEGMRATTLMGSLKLRRNDMWGRENVLRGTPLGRP